MLQEVAHAQPNAMPVEDRRRHRRVPVRLFGRFMRANRQEYPCQAIDMSAGGVALFAPVMPEEGERIIAYFDKIGRIEGAVVRQVEGGFAIAIRATAHKREKLVNQLTWLHNCEKLGLIEERQYERFAPKDSSTILTLADGSTVECRLLDVSLGGASVAIEDRPEIGMELLLGRLRGRVARHHEHGIGVQFLDVQDTAALQKHFG